MLAHRPTGGPEGHRCSKRRTHLSIQAVTVDLLPSFHSRFQPGLFVILLAILPADFQTFSPSLYLSLSRS